jgi:hypothetical protein
VNGTESYVELRFFCPFDINKIPERILEAVHEQAIGTRYERIPDQHQLTLPEWLTAVCDEVELKNGIRKELIAYYSI